MSSKIWVRAHDDGFDANLWGEWLANESGSRENSLCSSAEGCVLGLIAERPQ